MCVGRSLIIRRRTSAHTPKLPVQEAGLAFRTMSGHIVRPVPPSFPLFRASCGTRGAYDTDGRIIHFLTPLPIEEHICRGGACGAGRPWAQRSANAEAVTIQDNWKRMIDAFNIVRRMNTYKGLGIYI
jgi:hypothetical protein